MNTKASLVYVTAPNCHFCEEGKAIVDHLAVETGLSIAHIDWDSPRATELIERERPLFPPALYLSERLLGYGRLSERRLRRLMREVAA
jgi:hypothetical protein